MPSTIKQSEKAAVLFHALSDETRLDIIEQLKDGEQCVCDLTNALQTGQSRLSFHLKVLKEAGLIKDRPEGRWMYYSLNPEATEELQAFAQWFKEASKVTRSSSRCC
jgi:ArsR family transcriptional regulator, arsenate/arsenite/antimonite-responsive transcriptional repressor